MKVSISADIMFIKHRYVYKFYTNSELIVEICFQHIIGDIEDEYFFMSDFNSKTRVFKVFNLKQTLQTR